MKTISEQEQWRLLALSSIKSKKIIMEPFKVVCINATAKFPENKGKLMQGETYTVIGDALVGDDGITGWLLAEVQHFIPVYGFRKCRFVRIGGPCEIDLAEERLAADQAEELDKEWARIVHEHENA